MSCTGTRTAGAPEISLKTNTAEIRGVFDELPILGLLAAVQECLPDLRKNPKSAILVTNGGLGYFDPKVDAVAVEWGAMGLSIANAAKHKMVGLLAAKLKPEGVYIGEVVVLGIVKGTAFDKGSGALEAKAIADKFWQLCSERKEQYRDADRLAHDVRGRPTPDARHRGRTDSR